MPQVNLATLNGQELRQLLDSSRRRGDASLSYRVLQEMAARRDAPAERRAGRRAAEPRHIDLGEPEAVDDIPPMPNWPPRALVTVADAPDEAPEYTHDEAEPEAPPMPPEHDRPLTLHDPQAEPFDDEAPLRMEAARPAFRPIELGLPAKPKLSRRRLLAGLALGLILGLAIGWLGGWLARDAMLPVAAPIQTAALTPPPAQLAPPPAAPEPAPQTPPAATAAQGATDLGPTPPSAPATSPPAPKVPEAPPVPAAPPVPDGAALELPAPDAETARPSKPPKKILPATAPATSAACAGAPTPADRAICGDAKLKRLQAGLRHAYDEALAAHEDRALLREHQLAWRDARSDVTDPDRLARLYEERIRKLNAATAEARRAQQP